ncbi:MAG TPA: hypothetical protein VIO11_07020 [Candidatus Methanoperedens sp.]
MSEWDISEWEKPYIEKYKIVVIDPGKIVAVMPLELGSDPCWAINAGIKEVAKTHEIKSIISVQERKYDGGSHATEVILIIEPKLVGQK